MVTIRLAGNFAQRGASVDLTDIFSPSDYSAVLGADHPVPGAGRGAGGRYRK